MIDGNNYYKGYTINDLFEEDVHPSCPYKIDAASFFSGCSITEIITSAENNPLYNVFKNLPKLPEQTSVFINLTGSKTLFINIHHYTKTNTGKKVYLCIEGGEIFYWYIDNNRYLINRYHNTINTKTKTAHKIIDKTISIEEIMFPSSAFNTITNHGETRLFLHQWCEAKLRKIVLYRPTIEDYNNKDFFKCFAVNTSAYYK